MGNNTLTEHLLIHYLDLRKAVGLLNILFPLLVAGGALLFFDTPLQSSYSAYYHTPTGDLLVGTFFANGVFLYCYRGYSKQDRIASLLAGISAIGIALFPIDPANTIENSIADILHSVFTALFFATLIYFCLHLFPKTNDSHPMSPEKKKRNCIYRFCGIAMILIGIVFAIVFFLPRPIGEMLDKIYFTFWLEIVANFIFGIAWFVKGEGILKDR